MVVTKRNVLAHRAVKSRKNVVQHFNLSWTLSKGCTPTLFRGANNHFADHAVFGDSLAELSNSRTWRLRGISD